jgi:hypothetical protein
MNQHTTTHSGVRAELVLLAPSAPPRPSESLSASIEAIGEWTLLLLTEVPLKRGTEVDVIAKGRILNGIVEWCNLDEPVGCYIQVRLKPDSRWSYRGFKPMPSLTLVASKKIAAKKCA